jgi:hypothetical protein
MLISPIFFIVSPDLGLAPVDPGGGGEIAASQVGWG